MNAPAIIRDPAAQPLDRVPAAAGLSFGGLTPKPIRTALPGKIRVILRPNEFARAVVRDGAAGARCFHVLDFGDHWQLGLETARNAHFSQAP